jgi:hypothetical protein
MALSDFSDEELRSKLCQDELGSRRAAKLRAKFATRVGGIKDALRGK